MSLWFTSGRIFSLHAHLRTLGVIVGETAFAAAVFGGRHDAALDGGAAAGAFFHRTLAACTCMASILAGDQSPPQIQPSALKAKTIKLSSLNLV